MWILLLFDSLAAFIVENGLGVFPKTCPSWLGAEFFALPVLIEVFLVRNKRSCER